MKYVIRKAKCGHWNIVQAFDTGTPIIVYRHVVHLVSFGDVLVLINGMGELVRAE